MVTTRSKTNSLPEKRALESEPAAPAPKKKRTVPTAKRNATAAKRKPIAKKPNSTNEPTPVESQASAVPETTLGQGLSKSFLDLPAELRNGIYVLALVQQESIDVLPSQPYLKEPGLAMVNKQIRTESLSIWYGENAYRVEGSSPAVRFLRSLSDEKLRMLQTVRISTTMDMPIEYARDRIKQLMREFKPRGLSQQVLQFEIRQTWQIQWATLDDIKRLIKQRQPGAHTLTNSMCPTEGER